MAVVAEQGLAASPAASVAPGMDQSAHRPANCPVDRTEQGVLAAEEEHVLAVLNHGFLSHACGNVFWERFAHDQ